MLLVQFSVFGRRDTLVPFEEFCHCGLIGEVKLFGDLLHRLVGVVEEFDQFADQQPVDHLRHRLTGYLAYDSAQILWRDTEFRGVEADRMALHDVPRQQRYEMFEYVAHSARLLLSAVIFGMVEICVCNVEQEHPECAAEHLEPEIVGMVLQDTLDSGNSHHVCLHDLVADNGDGILFCFEDV